jgi:hypothetical protein
MSTNWTYPISSAAPAPGSVLALDSTGANIVAAPGMSQIVAASTPPAAGSVLALNSAGTNIVAGTGLLMIYASGQTQITQSIPAGSQYTQPVIVSGLVTTDVVMLTWATLPTTSNPNPTSSNFIITDIPWFGSAGGGFNVDITNVTSAAVSVNGTLNWMVLRAS